MTSTREEFARMVEELEDAAVWDLGRVAGARQRALAAYGARDARVKELEPTLNTALDSGDLLAQIARRQSARIAELETALQDKELELAQTWALVLSHEGHIEKLDARIAELEAACGAVVEAINDLMLTPQERAAVDACIAALGRQE
jgi:chromosome segregation ATPase